MGYFGRTTCLHYFSLFVQLFSAVAALGVIVVGCIQLNGTSNTFGVIWCSTATYDARDCWANNFNQTVALSYYAIALIVVGIVAVVTELRIKQYNRIPGFLGICGIFTIGAASNTGIVLGAFAMFMCFLQLVLHVGSGARNGPYVLSGDTLSRRACIAVQLFAALAALAVAATGIICIVGVAQRGTGSAGLRWCEEGDRHASGHDCWLGTGTSDYALGSYGASLVVLGLFACAVDLRLVRQTESLQDWNALGPLYIVMGALTMGAAGNTGILVGSVTMFAGLVLLSVAVVYGQRLGYDSLSA